MKKSRIVATIKKWGRAIDDTPIYEITVVKGIKSGDILHWDAEENTITRIPRNPDDM